LLRQVVRSAPRSGLSLARLPSYLPSARFPSASSFSLSWKRSFSHQVDAIAPPKSTVHIEQVFGQHCFNARAQRQYLSPDVFKEMQTKINNQEPISPDLADRFAAGLHRWAADRGATHFTHWFIPLTNRSASKHDAFMKRSGDHVISTFSGKTLSQSETDGSSFPNGGLRATHTARGYTIWDPSSLPFIINHDTGATLYIPSIFISWKGNALDEKTPLLRASQALNTQGLRLLKATGDSSHSLVRTDAGLEQEFFLVDKEFVLKRPDILQTGRTLLGAAPPRGQELSDQYFSDLSERTMGVIDELEVELWRLGIPQTTRHKEVAPGQYEIAPVFSPTTIASDQNMIQMEVMQRIAHKHGMEALLHEKPFAGLNGSGKHNNWSIGTDKIGTLYEPGSKPHENDVFMMMLAMTLRMVHKHQDLLRCAVATAGNDHRLGGHEAPPAIISVYLGSEISEAMEKYIVKDSSALSFKANKDLGFSCHPDFRVDSTDRNRTSPFAFTGNKFEFRAVGASQIAHRSNYILNAAAAESCGAMADEIEKLVSSGKTPKQATQEVTRRWLQQHKTIVFDGDCYSQAWRDESAKRGLLNMKTTPEALATWNTPKNVKLFGDLGVFNADDMKARSNIWSDEFTNKVKIEALSLAQILASQVLPAGLKTQTALAEAVSALKGANVKESAAQEALLKSVSVNVEGIVKSIEKLRSLSKQALSIEDELERANFSLTQLRPALKEARGFADSLEGQCDAKDWPLPSYHQMLYTGQVYGL